MSFANRHALDALFRTTLDLCRSAAALPVNGRLPASPVIPSRRLVILGNGPSLVSGIDAGRAEGGHLLGVNTFANTELFARLRPVHYVIADLAFWDLRGPEGLRRKAQQLWDRIGELTSWPMTIYLPSGARSFRESYASAAANPNVKFCYFSARRALSRHGRTLHGVFARNLLMPNPQNVLIAAVYVGIQLGYGQLALLGADHDWVTQISVDAQSRLCLRDPHFSRDDADTAKPWIDIFGRQYRVHEVMGIMQDVFKAHDDLAAYARARGIRVVNETSTSLIDAYPKV